MTATLKLTSLRNGSYVVLAWYRLWSQVKWTREPPHSWWEPLVERSVSPGVQVAPKLCFVEPKKTHEMFVHQRYLCVSHRIHQENHLDFNAVLTFTGFHSWILSKSCSLLVSLSPSWDADSNSGGPEDPAFVSHLDVHYRLHNSLLYARRHLCDVV